MSQDDARVFVFATTWSMDALAPEAVHELLARVDALGVELILLCRTGVWSVRPGDDDVQRHSDRFAGDAATTVTAYAASRGGDGVFVTDDEGRVVRVGGGDAGHGLFIALDNARDVIARWRAAREAAAPRSAAPVRRQAAVHEPAPPAPGGHP